MNAIGDVARLTFLSIATGKSKQRGFTLLEMLLTVFLIGLVTGLVVLNIGQDNEDIAKLEARRFAALVKHLQDESTVAGIPMGVSISESAGRYSFWMLQDEWEVVDDIDVLRERTLPEDIALSILLLQTEGKIKDSEPDDESEPDEEDKDNKKSAIPQNLLVVEPTGLIRPFIASFTAGETTFNVAIDNALKVVVSEENES